MEESTKHVSQQTKNKSATIFYQISIEHLVLHVHVLMKQ
jgi:hypothetical protein